MRHVLAWLSLAALGVTTTAADELRPAIVPGDAEQSLLIHRVRGDLPGQDPMPPDGKLTDAQIAVLVQWVKDGAVWAAPAENSPPG